MNISRAVAQFVASLDTFSKRIQTPEFWQQDIAARVTETETVGNSGVHLVEQATVEDKQLVSPYVLNLTEALEFGEVSILYTGSPVLAAQAVSTFYKEHAEQQTDVIFA